MTPRPFPPARPHGDLLEVLPDVYVVTGSMWLGPMRFSRNMVVLREAGRVVLVNSVRLDERGLATLDALGPVTDVLRLAGVHGVDDPFYKDRYNCTVHVLRGMSYFTGTNARLGTRYFEADNELDTHSELPIAGGSLYSFGCDPPEALLRIPAGGGTLIAGDSLQNWATTDRWFNWIGKLGMRAMGFIRPCQLGPGWLRLVRPDPGAVQGILGLGFANVLPSHGTPVLGDARERFTPAIIAYRNALDREPS